MPDTVYLVICELKGCKPVIDWACASFETAYAAAQQVFQTLDAPYGGYLWKYKETQVAHRELYIDVYVTCGQVEKPYATIKVKAMPLFK
jgi:hypothetical protein